MKSLKRSSKANAQSKSTVGNSPIWSPQRFSLRQYGLVLVGLLIVAGGIALFAASPGSTPSTGGPMDGNVALSLPISGTPFAASSFWNTPLSASTPANPNTAAYVNEITNQVCYGSTAFAITPPNITTTPCTTSNISALNINNWTAPLYVVPANQPLVPVTRCSGYATSTTFSNAVAGGVPIPADAHASGQTNVPDNDTDAEIQIYQPSTNTLWEFWRAQKQSNGSWAACWGGVINNVSESNGIFPNNTGATATSLPLIGGIPRIEEFQAGQIDHVIDLSLGQNFYRTPLPGITSTTCTATPPTCTVPANITDPSRVAYSWPATRNDGWNSNTLAIPEGQRFRLNPNLNLSTLGLSPMAMTIAVAAQKYGFVVDDSGHSVAIRLGNPTTYTTAGLPNPYTTGVGVGGVNNGNLGLFDGKSQSQIMANFPWGQLQALPFNYGETDTTPPTVSLAAPASGATVSGTTIVTATATDNIGVTSVQFELDGKALGSALTAPNSGSSYSYAWDTTGVSSGVHTLTAIASDAAGNTTTATSITVTAKNADTTPPSTPTGLKASAPTSAQVNLSWTAATDNIGVTGYRVYRNGSSTALVTVPAPTTTYTDAAVSATTTYTYTVTALDAAGNQSAQSASVSVTTPANPDKIPPTVPKELTGSAIGQTSAALTWRPSTDTGGSGLAGYHLYRNGTLIASPTGTTYTDTGLAAGTKYTYRVSAYDKAANGSTASPPVRITTGGTSPDQTPPTIPSDLRSIQKAKTTTAISLTWEPSSDSGGSGLAGYHLYRDGTLIASPTGTTYTDTGLAAGTKYIYYVKAYDNAGNVSNYHNTVAVITRHPRWQVWYLGN
jgi:chitodextrinase